MRARLVPTKEHREALDRHFHNLTRVDNLIDLYRSIAGTQKGRRTVQQSDLLRAAVVLLHATLEDFLRHVAQERLPLASASVLDGIPLAGLAQTGRAEKFYLGKLASFRGSLVDDVITESVALYLQRSTFNDASEVVTVLKSCGVNTARIERYLPEIQQLMKRRHQIVHRADRLEATAKGKPLAQAIRVDAVEAWAVTVGNLVKVVLADLYAPGYRFSGERQAN
jgi:hypothetical protein